MLTIRTSVLCLLLAAAALAQQFPFRTLGEREGLADTNILSLAQDRTGYIWIGTARGLVRYDGLRFREYGPEQGLAAGEVRALTVSPNGVLWVGTATGLARLQGQRFEMIAELSGAAVNANGLAIESSGRLLAGTNRGLAYGPADGTGRFQWKRSNGMSGDPVYAIFPDKSGVTYFGCGPSLCEMRGDQVSVVLWEKGLGRGPWEAISSDAEGNLWLRSQRRLFRRAPGSDTFVSEDMGYARFATGVPALIRDRAGRFYVPTDTAMLERVRGDWKTIGSSQGLPSGPVQCALEDREGSLWLGVAGQGLVWWQGYRDVRQWTKSAGLPGNRVQVLLRQPSGALWIGTERGLARLADGQDPTAWDEKSNLAGVRIQALALDSNGTLWTGSNPGGVTRIDTTARKLDAFGAKSGLEDERVLSLAFDGEHTLWAGTAAGLFRGHAQGTEMRFSRVTVPGSNAGESFPSMLASPDGILWIAGSEGLLRLERGTWNRFGTKDGLKSNAVAALARHPDGGLWIAYREPNGISRLEISGAQVKSQHIRASADGLLSDAVRTITVDRSGRIWVASAAGAQVYSPAEGWRFWGMGRGLLSHQVAAILQDSDRLWFGTPLGLTEMPAPLALDRAQVPAPSIDSFVQGSRSVAAQFSTLLFSNREAVRYRWRLAGSSDPWTETDQAEAHVATSGWGDLALEVQATMPGASWSDTARATFSIPGPFYSSWWFRGTLLLMACGLAYEMYRRREKRVLAHHHYCEFAVEQRTRELFEEKAKAAEQAARALETSQLKSEFVANMSHEIRTPMNGILGLTGLVLEGQLSPDQRSSLETVRSSAETLLELFNNLLDFSKIEAGSLLLEESDFSLRRTVQQVVQSLEAKALCKSLTLTWNVDAAVPDMLLGDRTRLTQVLLNLVANAVKFTNEGKVEVTVRPDQTVRVRRPGEAQAVRIHFSVADTGIGIPPEKQRIVFEAFRQADGSSTRTYGGTGLGLALCARLVSLMSGEIWVESVLHHGSTFHFTVQFKRQVMPAGLSPLPETVTAVEPATNNTESLAALAARLGTRTVAPAPAEEPASAPAASTPAEPAPEGSFHILVAEDNLVNQTVVRRLLTKRGYAVTVVSDGKEAVDAVLRDHFDLVLMDVQMPNMDGLEAAAAIRDFCRGRRTRTPMIALTAHATKSDRDRCLASGMDGYLVKPVRSKDLYEAIDAILGTTDSPLVQAAAS